MRRVMQFRSARKGVAAAVTSALCGMALVGSPAVMADEGNSFRIGGYVRGWASFNLRDVPDTPQNDRGELSMLRGSILLDADAKTGPVAWKAIVRADGEHKTDYLKRLENLTRTKTPGGPGSDVMDEYNRTELREFYADMNLGERVKLRLGKQQVVWGETDFFRAMDLVHGYDMRWRSFLEPENEELRKPLILANMTVQVPEADGALQLIVRPGWDGGEDIGNTYDLYGGRWALQTFRGADFLSKNVTGRYDFHHPDGDIDDVTWGARWKGIAGPVDYSLAYLETFNPDPIANTPFAPFKKMPSSPFVDWIFPKIRLFGVTASGQVPSIDAVLSTEIVYVKDAPYNVGTNFPVAPLGTPNTIAGFNGVKKKDTLLTMLRVDKNLNLQSLLGTNRDSFFSVQLFDKWILGYARKDDIVDLVGYNAPKSEHSTILTTILVTNFKNDTINPSLALGFDVRHGGGFAIPAVEFVTGDKWRLRAEADLFFYDDQRKPALNSVTGLSEFNAHLFGALAHSDQFLLRLTRQF